MESSSTVAAAARHAEGGMAEGGTRRGGGSRPPTPCVPSPAAAATHLRLLQPRRRLTACTRSVPLVLSSRRSRRAGGHPSAVVVHRMPRHGYFINSSLDEFDLLQFDFLGELGLVLSPVPVGSKMPSGRSSPDHHHHHHQQQAAAVAMGELAAGSRRQQQDHHLHLQHQQQQPAFATAESAGASNRDVKPLTKLENLSWVCTTISNSSMKV
ncbi:hypothetical protein ZWY2020_056950 [Hordeum vulgare]|nr:hypothetical protein ZWY2020_056950 [Hordeum vulgare]